ncbi:tryptophan--tRNA ligase, partial [Candidatus Falkowbacteria bacterium CG10_big_fil_rev_8_21_14_0_10_37_6]
VEIARDTAEKFNLIYGETFKLPEPLIDDSVATIPGIDGRKMSKSYNNTIPLFASDEEIKKAVMSIVTDSKEVDEPKETKNDTLFSYHLLFSKQQLPELEKRYHNGGIGYKESKEILIENMKSFIAPLREKKELLKQDTQKVLAVLNNGGEKARECAKNNMSKVRKIIGLI